MVIRFLQQLSAVVLLFFVWVPVSTADSAAAQDDWVLVSPESVGLDSEMLSKLNDDIRNGEYLNIHSLLVFRNDKLAFEAYYKGEDERRGQPVGVVDFDADTLHDMRSVTKSVVSALFGIAVTEQLITDIDEPVLNFFPEYENLRTPERMAMRLRDLLSMTSGLRWDEDTHPYGDSRNSETAMDRADDAYRFVLEQPMADKPGQVFSYNGGNTMLLYAVLERAVGMPLDKYAEQVLFGPLGIDRYEWLKYPDGKLIAASGLRLRPRDAAKLGVMFLNDGLWEGQRVVAESWVQNTLFPHAVISNRPTGFQRYGYQWWLGSARVGDAMVPWSAAVGWGGQRVLIVPSMDLVAVLTTGMYNNPAHTGITFEILLDRVLPAVK